MKDYVIAAIKELKAMPKDELRRLVDSQSPAGLGGEIASLRQLEFPVLIDFFKGYLEAERARFEDLLNQVQIWIKENETCDHPNFKKLAKLADMADGRIDLDSSEPGL